MCYLVAIPHYLLDEALPFLFRLLRSCFRLHLRCEVSTPRLNLHRTGLFKQLDAFILWCAWSGLDHLTQKNAMTRRRSSLSVADGVVRLHIAKALLVYDVMNKTRS